MGELLSELGNTVIRYKKFIQEDGVSPGDVKALLSPGTIEKLVAERRSPVRRGSIGGSGIVGLQGNYEVPPPGIDQRDITQCYEDEGEHVYVNRLGVKRWGTTYTLNDEQEAEVLARISAEELRLGRI